MLNTDIGKIWYNGGKEKQCMLFLTVLDNLDNAIEWDDPDRTLKGIETDIACELYQANRNRYPKYTW